MYYRGLQYFVLGSAFIGDKCAVVNRASHIKYLGIYVDSEINLKIHTAS